MIFTHRIRFGFAGMLLLAVVAASSARADEPAPAAVAKAARVVQQGGLAAKYPGDEGIERDPRVLFVDDFETGTIQEIGACWGNIQNAEQISSSDDIPAGSPGVRSLPIRDNGHLFTHTKGVDTMFARFYVKFHEQTGYS